MKRRLGVVAALACVASLTLSQAAWAVEPGEMLNDPRLEARAEAISKTLRCVVCQNENIDDSGAPLASDMRRLVRERVSAGDTDDQVRAYLVARYGNFVLLKPPLQPDTWLLWFGPAAVLLLAGGLLIWGSTYVHNTVQSQLAAQQITFPPASAFAHPKAGSEITPSMIPLVSQYAGQQLLTGQQAEAYADHFIAVHIANMTGGKTYAQLSTAAQAQPNNTQLANQVSTVFKGETLRSMLLNAYGWWKVSQITYIASLIAFGLGTVAGVGSIYLFIVGRRNRGDAPMPPAGHETISPVTTA